jgi:oligosaccharide repeat unit polymerase
MISKKKYKIPLHDIRLYIVMHGILLFLLRPYLTYKNGPNVITGLIHDDFYFISFVIGIVAFLIMLITVLNTNNKGQDSSFYLCVSQIKFIRFVFVFFLWLTFYIAFNIDRLKLGLFELMFQPQVDFIQSNSTFISNSLTGIYPIFIIAAFSIDIKKKTKLLTIIFLVLFALPIGIISGSKSLVLNPLFLLLLRYSARNKGLSLMPLFMIMIIGVPIFASLELVRHEGLIGLTNFFSSKNDNFQLDNVLLVATNRFYGTDILYSIIYYHESLNRPFLLGSSLLGLVFFIVPRALWENKPIISFGKVVSDQYLGSEFWSTGISAAPTWVGELFANFGYFSIIFYVLSVFLVMRHISRCYSSRARAWKKVYYYPIAFTTLCFFQEASIAGWILQLLTFAFLCYLFSILFHGKKYSIKNGI